MSIGGKCEQIDVDSRGASYAIPQRCLSANRRADRNCSCHHSAILSSAKVTAVTLRESPFWCCVTDKQSHNLKRRARLTRGSLPMKRISIGILVGLFSFTSADAAGWSSVHKYVKRSGNCAGQEILAS